MSSRPSSRVPHKRSGADVHVSVRGAMASSPKCITRQDEDVIRCSVARVATQCQAESKAAEAQEMQPEQAVSSLEMF